ncbi:cytochrome P450 71B37-like protein [Tanacetum coccineum]
MARQVLKTHDSVMCSRPQSKGAKRITFNYMDVAFSPHDDHSKDMCKFMVSEFLGAKRTRLFKNEIENEMEGKSYAHKIFDGRTLKEIADETVVMLSGSFSDYFPTFGWIIDVLLGWNRRLEKCFTDLEGALQMVIDEHLEPDATKTSDDEKDLVDECISRLTCDETKALLMVSSLEEFLKAECVEVFGLSEDAPDEVAGGDGTAGWILGELSDLIKLWGFYQVKDEQHSTGARPNLQTSKPTRKDSQIWKEKLPSFWPDRLKFEVDFIENFEKWYLLEGAEERARGLAVSWGVFWLTHGGKGRDPSIWEEHAGEFYTERTENLEVDFEMLPFGSSKIEDLNMQEECSFVLSKKLPLRLVPTKNN